MASVVEEVVRGYQPCRGVTGLLPNTTKHYVS